MSSSSFFTSSRLLPSVFGSVFVSAPPLIVILRTVFSFTGIAPSISCVSTLSLGTSDEYSFPAMLYESVFSLSLTLASSSSLLTTHGTLTIPSSVYISSCLLALKPMIPAAKSPDSTSTTAAMAGTAILSHTGHFLGSNTLLMPSSVSLTVSSVVSSYIRVSISLVRLSTRICMAFIIALSRFFDIPLTYFEGGCKVFFPSFSRYALRSMASGGVTPVIILYRVAPTAYTSV